MTAYERILLAIAGGSPDRPSVAPRLFGVSARLNGYTIKRKIMSCLEGSGINIATVDSMISPRTSAPLWGQRVVFPVCGTQEHNGSLEGKRGKNDGKRV